MRVCVADRERSETGEKRRIWTKVQSTQTERTDCIKVNMLHLLEGNCLKLKCFIARKMAAAPTCN